MAAVILAPHPEPRRPALRLVVSTPHEPGLARSRRVAPRRPSRAVYWRRRATVLLVAVTLVALGWAAAGAMGAGSADDLSIVTAASLAAPLAPAAAPDAAPTAPVAPKVYVVRPGDTVWSIAERLHPEGDVRELVDQLTERAGGSGLQAGQRIALDGLAV
jgi:hypothetical protein